MAILSIFYFGVGNLYLILMGLLIVGGGIGFVLGSDFFGWGSRYYGKLGSIYFIINYN